MSTILNYDSQGFIVGSQRLERGIKAVNDDTQEIIQILKAQNQIANTRLASIASNAERIAQRNTTGRLLNRTAPIHGSEHSRDTDRTNHNTSPSNTNTNGALRGATRTASNHNSASQNNSSTNQSNSNAQSSNRDERGRFTSGSHSESDSLLDTLRRNVNIHGVDSEGVDPLIDSINETRQLLSPLAHGAGMAGRAAKWTWSKFKAMKRREPLPRAEERHNRENEDLLERILRQLQSNHGSSSGLLGSLLNGGRGLLGGGLIGGLFGGLLKGGKGLGKLLKPLAKMKFLGPLAAMFGIGDLAMDWGNLDHAGKSAGVGSLVGAGAGALIGGTLGSVLGPVGTVVGAAIGGWLGSEAGEWLGETASPYIEEWTDKLASYNLPDKMRSFWEDGIKPFFSRLGDIGSKMTSWIDDKVNAAKDFLGLGGGGNGEPPKEALNAAQYAMNHALSTYAGRCAEYVNNAWQAQGFKAGGHGKDVAKNLMNWNKGKFEIIPYDENYVPQIGDVLSMPSHSKSKHNYGHAQMFTEDGWYSDTKQNNNRLLSVPNDQYEKEIMSGQIKPTIVRMKGEKKAVTPLPQDQRARRDQVVDYFINKGYTKAQAAGIAANIQQESQFNHTVKGDKENGVYQAYGLAQWRDSRLQDFKNRYGKDIRNSTFEEQLDFINYELSKGKEKAAGYKLKTAKTAKQAGAIVSQYYERPADEDGEKAKRAKIAESIYKNYTINKSLANKVKPSATSSSLGFSLGNLTSSNQFLPASHNISKPIPSMPKTPVLQFPSMPKISQRLDSGGQKPIIIQANSDTINQNVSDRGLAHAITGGLGQDRYWG
ncbi:phage tail tip lysozyme [Psychrobacter sp. I-STPA10]|uniref:phage tail tip lysozyme n=1 Tax=Psychrobacter sp. I-STPA10 TaxID=2585769 RepID=UPI001E30E35C|nr:phage tail tip lysozyme [Psychrobacter sp. I-STPA10]